MADRVGQQLDNYRLIHLLGAGTFGEVYLGEHIYSKSQVAVKVLKVQLTSNNLREFLNEARTFRLKHPHIVQLLDFGIEDETPFLVMHYMPNGTLRQRYPQGTRLSLTTILSYVKQVASALQYAHDMRLIHRDVKPQNMLLGRNQEVLLSDFGIAVVAHNEGSMSTQEMAGTVPYMAPEQIRGKPQPASDQYSLGIVVYEWLCGVRPFQGSQWTIINQHISVQPPSLREKLPSIPSALEGVVFRTLFKEPQERFSCVQDFAFAFEQACHIAEQPLETRHTQQPIRGLSPFAGVISPYKLLQTTFQAPSQEQLSQSVPVTPFPIPNKPQSPKQQISRRTAIASLAGLVVVGGGITWLELSQNVQKPSQGTTSSSHSIPRSTPSVRSDPTPNATIIGSTNLAVNSSVDFNNPTDNKASLLVHTPNGHFFAYEKDCTHEGVEVYYDPTIHMFVCPAHGSVFDPSNGGKVLQGPAVTPLKLVSIRVNTDGTITTW